MTTSPAVAVTRVLVPSTLATTSERRSFTAVARPPAVLLDPAKAPATMTMLGSTEAPMVTPVPPVTLAPLRAVAVIWKRMKLMAMEPAMAPTPAEPAAPSVTSTSRALASDSISTVVPPLMVALSTMALTAPTVLAVRSSVTPRLGSPGLPPM